MKSSVPAPPRRPTARSLPSITASRSSNGSPDSQPQRRWGYSRQDRRRDVNARKPPSLTSKPVNSSVSSQCTLHRLCRGTFSRAPQRLRQDSSLRLLASGNVHTSRLKHAGIGHPWADPKPRGHQQTSMGQLTGLTGFDLTLGPHYGDPMTRRRGLRQMARATSQSPPAFADSSRS